MSQKSSVPTHPPSTPHPIFSAYQSRIKPAYRGVFFWGQYPHQCPCPWFRASDNCQPVAVFSVNLQEAWAAPVVPSSAGRTIPMHRHARHPFNLFTTSQFSHSSSSQCRFWMIKIMGTGGGLAFFPPPFFPRYGRFVGKKEMSGLWTFFFSSSFSTDGHST